MSELGQLSVSYRGLLGLNHDCITFPPMGCGTKLTYCIFFPLQDIHALITSLNYTGINIKTINAVESWNGGILVVVSGSVKAKDFSGRKFMETFFLAPQEKGFYVLNDIFQFVNEEMIPQNSAAIVSENEVNTQSSASNSIPEPTGGFLYFDK